MACRLVCGRPLSEIMIAFVNCIFANKFTNTFTNRPWPTQKWLGTDWVTNHYSSQPHGLGCQMTSLYSTTILHVSIMFEIARDIQTNTIQIKICAEYRDMLPRPRLVCQEPGLRPIGRSPGVPDKSSRGLGSMSRYSAQILICFIAYIFHFLFLCGFGWEFCRTVSMHSALCHCPL